MAISTTTEGGSLKAPAALPFAYPLDEFYAQAGRVLPAISQVEGSAVPEPFASLLVHQNDMTPTLEKFHQEKIRLEVIGRQHRNDFYFREVVLLLENSGKRVEFGAIKINLALFPPAARRQILEEQAPLGRILHEHGIFHTSRPKAFLRITPDDFIKGALGLTSDEPLFGRRNTLSDSVQRPLAEIVEILPPSHKPNERNE
jgi:chorismate-pyruvate lyase